MVRFTAEDDAVTWANDTEFGLLSYVYTRDLSRGLRVSEALEAGMIDLNRGIMADPAAPFGGVNRRGEAVRHRPRGRARGTAGIHRDEYTATSW